MDNFLEILHQEKRDLQEKHSELKAFLLGDKITTLTKKDRVLLNIQEKAMATYLQCLEARLALL